MEAIYARQSVEKLDSLSIEAQIQQCKRFTQDDVQVYQDKGFSGKNTNRPAFQQLMSDVENGKITKIFVYRVDRFSRSIVDFGQVWKFLEDHGVQFQSITENFDTSTPLGRAMLNVIMTFAQLERETTAERVRDNYHHRFSLGAWPGGPAPLGFSLTKIRDENGRRVSSLLPNDQAIVIQKIYEAYAEKDASLGSVARLLNAEKIPGAKRSTWDSVAISRVLHNPAYVQATEDIYWFYLSKGMEIQQPPDAFDGYHGCNLIGRRDRSRGKYQDLQDQKLTIANHLGIIPTNLWLACQEKLEKNTQLRRDRAGKYSWLSGLLKCAECGYALRINKLEEKLYLLCSGRSNLGICTASIRIDVRELEEYIATQLQAMLDACPEETVAPPDNETFLAIQRLDARIERLVNAIAESDGVAVEYISREIQRSHTEKDKLQQKLRNSIKKPTRMQLNFSQLSFAEKKVVATEYIERVTVVDDHVNIIWRV